MKKSRRTLEIEARKAADPIAQAVGRTDIDYTDPDQLPTAPRGFLHHGIEREIPIEPQIHEPTAKGKIVGWVDDPPTVPESNILIHADFKCSSCTYESIGARATAYKFCPMCGQPKIEEIFNDRIIHGRI